jgi:hypothetical protein
MLDILLCELNPDKHTYQLTTQLINNYIDLCFLLAVQLISVFPAAIEYDSRLPQLAARHWVIRKATQLSSRVLNL